MKKFIAMLLVCLMVVAVLTSCPKPVSNDNEETTKDNSGDVGEQPKVLTPHEKTLAALTEGLNVETLSKLLNSTTGTVEIALAPENAPFTSITAKAVKSTTSTILNVVASVNDTDYKVNVFADDKNFAANFENLNNTWYGFNLENLATQFESSIFSYKEGAEDNILDAETSELVKTVLEDLNKAFETLSKKEPDADTKAAVEAFVNVIKKNLEKINKATEKVTVDGYEADCTTYTIDQTLLKGIVDDTKTLLDNEKVVNYLNKIFGLVEKFAAIAGSNEEVVVPNENEQSAEGENAEPAEGENNEELPPIQQPTTDITAFLSIDAMKDILDQASAMIDTLNFKLIAKTYVADEYLTKVELSFALAMPAEAPEAAEAAEAELADLISVAVDFGKTPSFENGVKVTVKVFGVNEEGETGTIEVVIKGENTDAKLAVELEMKGYTETVEEETIKLAFNYDKTAKTYAFTASMDGIEQLKVEGKFSYTENSLEFTTDKVSTTPRNGEWDEETQKMVYTAGETTTLVVNLTFKVTLDNPTVTAPDFTNVFEMTKGNLVDLVEEIKTKFPSQVDPEPTPAE